MFFFLALYMQNILGYSPLEAGVRFLPTTLMIVLVAPISGRLTDRIGPRWLIAVGLSLVTLSLYLQTRITVDTTYADLWPAFVLMGIGIAMTMSPMSTAAMNAVSATKAGIASGLLSMSRMVGGSFGVAAIGALFQAKAGDLNPSAAAHQTPQAAHAAAQTFVDALSSAMVLSTGVAATGAVVAATMLGSHIRQRPGREAGAETAVGAPAVEAH
jgi:MFS family permease